MSAEIERDGTGLSDAELLEMALSYMKAFASHPMSGTPGVRLCAASLKRRVIPGCCLAHWVDARELQPPPGQLVTVAYLWPGDDFYTVDTAELDGDVWRYSGGDLMSSEEVHWWCHAPAAPAVAGRPVGAITVGQAVLAA